MFGLGLTCVLFIHFKEFLYWYTLNGYIHTITS